MTTHTVIVIHYYGSTTWPVYPGLRFSVWCDVLHTNRESWDATYHQVLGVSQC